MARNRFDGVIEAVRYTAEGQIALVRVYERRGSSFSDHVLVDRAGLVARIKKGKRLVAGKRLPYQASTFETGGALALVKEQGGEYLANGKTTAGHDHLDGVPQF